MGTAAAGAWEEENDLCMAGRRVAAGAVLGRPDAAAWPEEGMWVAAVAGMVEVAEAAGGEVHGRQVVGHHRDSLSVKVLLN